MSVRMIKHADGGSMCFGRKRPAAAELARAPWLDRYLTKAAILPPPALRADWALGAALNKAGLENVLGNDTLGDCVEAACGHVIDAWHGDAGTGVSVSADQAIAFYSATSGYVPGKPNTDQGSDPVTVLNYWRTKGYSPGAQPIAGYVGIDPTNETQLKTAVWLFGGVLLGGELLTAWVNGMGTMRSGFTWDVGSAPDAEAGHEVYGYGYNDNGVFIDSWAMFGTMTWAAVAQFAAAKTGGDVLCPLSQDWIAKASALAPSGFNFVQLQADLSAL
jgi:hypothetical protein